MTPEHYQLIISDLYEENYKSNFAKDLRENINDLTDFDWMYQHKSNHGVGGSVGGGNGFSDVGGVGGGGGGVYFGGGVGGGSGFFGSSVGVGGYGAGAVVGIGGGNVEGFNGGFGNIVGGDN